LLQLRQEWDEASRPVHRGNARGRGGDLGPEAIKAELRILGRAGQQRLRVLDRGIDLRPRRAVRGRPPIQDGVLLAQDRRHRIEAIGGWRLRQIAHEAGPAGLQAVGRNPGVLRLGDGGVPAMDLAEQRIAALANLHLVEGGQIRLQQAQFLELVVLGDRCLPPGRRFDRLYLAEAPHHRVGDRLLQAASDGAAQRLTEGALGMPDRAGKEVLARHGRERYGGQQAANDPNEDQTPQTPHRTTPLFR